MLTGGDPLLFCSPSHRVPEHQAGLPTNHFEQRIEQEETEATEVLNELYHLRSIRSLCFLLFIIPTFCDD